MSTGRRADKGEWRMRGPRYWRLAAFTTALLTWLLIHRTTAQKESFQFVILGDRTGEALPGAYERVWQEAAEEDPAFVVSVGDSIEGLKDATAEDEWLQLGKIL